MFVFVFVFAFKRTNCCLATIERILLSKNGMALKLRIAIEFDWIWRVGKRCNWKMADRLAKAERREVESSIVDWFPVAKWGQIGKRGSKSLILFGELVTTQKRAIKLTQVLWFFTLSSGGKRESEWDSQIANRYRGFGVCVHYCLPSCLPVSVCLWLHLIEFEWDRCREWVSKWSRGYLLAFHTFQKNISGSTV